jgi:hypothetical protein
MILVDGRDNEIHGKAVYYALEEMPCADTPL